MVWGNFAFYSCMNKPERKPVSQVPFQIFSIVMGLVYLGLGAMFIFNLTGKPFMPSPYQEMFGFVIAGYGAFRFLRVWQLEQQKRKSQNPNF
jgi:hypothetical protein